MHFSKPCRGSTASLNAHGAPPRVLQAVMEDINCTYTVSPSRVLQVVDAAKPRSLCKRFAAFAVAWHCSGAAVAEETLQLAFS
eukprot:1400338-Amphidinium_carterae.1